MLVAHNAPFDVGMLDRALMRLDGTRIGMRVLDTVGLARRLLAGRLARFDLGSVSERFDVTVRPCHRALPDALATAEVLLGLIGLAQERGAESAEDVMALALAAPRRARQRRHLAAGLPSGPGVYVMRDRLGQALYVGKAGDLRTRVRSYFGARRQPPRIEGALAALEAIEVAPTGSELEAALAELDLIRRWRPPGNVRDARPDKSVYLRLALAEHAPALGLRTTVRDDGALYAGPFTSRRLATEAAEGLRDGYRLAPAGRACRWTTAAACAARPAAAWRTAAAATTRSPTSARRAPWRPGWPARRRCSTRRCAPVSRAWSSSSASRTPGARACWTPCARRTPRSPASGERVAAPASCSRPISTRATSSPSPSCAARWSPSGACPGRATRGSSSAPSPPRSNGHSTPPRHSSRAPRDPGSRPSGYSEALLAQAFAGRAPGRSCRMPWRSKAAAARRTVPLREALPPGRHARAEDLAAVA